MHGVEHTVSFFSMTCLKYTFVHLMIFAYKVKYNNFGSSIYNKPNSIFKSKSQESHNKTIGVLVEIILGWIDI